METLLDLVVDNQSVTGRLATTGAIILVAVALSALISWVLTRTETDPYSRYYKNKITRYVFTFISIIAIGVTWRAFAGQAGVVLGLLAAGVAFAMQEVIGALAGWFNIMSGRIFRVGDRIDMAGVRGDVIDITPLRTKILEMGGATSGGTESDTTSWVKGRQYTGRIVSVSNKATFTEPLYNYSSVFDFIWEELTIPVPYDNDWREAEKILLLEIQRTQSQEAEAAMDYMQARYPIPRTEIEPRVFVRATDNWMEISGRFLLPVRSARGIKDQVTRRVIDEFDRRGITIASQTIDVTVRAHEGETGDTP